MDYSETLPFPFLTVRSGTHFRVNGIGFILSDATFIGSFFDDLLHFSLHQHLHFVEVDLITFAEEHASNASLYPVLFVRLFCCSILQEPLCGPFAFHPIPEPTYIRP